MLDIKEIVINPSLTIPIHELDFRFTTSSGPGGQHANKASTRVIVSFDVQNSPSLSDYQRELLLKKLASRLDKDGVIQLSVQTHRSQFRNREEAIGRFQALIATALTRPKPRRKTKISRAKKQKRLDAKKRQGNKKRDRSKIW